MSKGYFWDQALTICFKGRFFYIQFSCIQNWIVQTWIFQNSNKAMSLVFWGDQAVDAKNSKSFRDESFVLPGGTKKKTESDGDHGIVILGAILAQRLNKKIRNRI